MSGLFLVAGVLVGALLVAQANRKSAAAGPQPSRVQDALEGTTSRSEMEDRAAHIGDILRLLAREPTDERYEIAAKLSGTNREHLEVLCEILRREDRAEFGSRSLSDPHPLLYRALLRGHHELAELLVAVGADATDGYLSGWPLIHAAAEDGKVDALRFLIEHGAPVSLRASTGDTPLHAAARRGQVGTTAALLTAGAEADAVTAFGWTPLHLAAYRNHIETCRTLLAGGADPNGNFSRVLEELRVGRGSKIDLGDGLLVEIDVLGAMTPPPIHWAANHGYVEIVPLLLRYGADPNLRDVTGQSALHWTVHGLCIDGTETQAIRGITRWGYSVGGLSDVTVPDGDDHSEIIRRLLAAGADVNAKNHEGRTPLHVLGISGTPNHHQLVSLLVAGEAHLELRDNDGQTAHQLAKASSAGYSDKVASELLEAGASPE